MVLNANRIRREFPALRPRRGQPAVHYLDSACMSLVPAPVLQAMEEYYTEYPGCGGRSLHRFSERVGERYEHSRAAFARFLGAPDPRGIVFVRNATEAINLVAQGLPWRAGERVLLTDQEHNSNLVVWQRLAAERGIRIDVLPLPERDGFDLEALERAITPDTRLASLFHTSNLDGRSLPIGDIAERLHARGVQLLVDGCQAAPHTRVDLKALGVDFYAVSAHKMLGPTGTGVLAAPVERLEGLRPLLLGGETVEWTSLEGHSLRGAPYRFEAGLQNYAGVIGAGVAVEWLERIGLEEVEAHDRALSRYAERALQGESRIRILGPENPEHRGSILPFTVDGVDPTDVALFLDEGHRVMLRSGMHCVHSWYRARGLTGNARASFYLYTNEGDVDALVTGLRELCERIPAASEREARPAPPIGTSVGTRAPRAPPGPYPARASGSRAAAARSAPPRGRAARGRAGSAAKRG